MADPKKKDAPKPEFGVFVGGHCIHSTDNQDDAKAIATARRVDAIHRGIHVNDPEHAIEVKSLPLTEA